MFISQLVVCLLWKNVCLGAEYSFFSSAHGTFSRIDCILGHKSNLSKFEKIEIISSIFSDHNVMRLDINYKKQTKKHKLMVIQQYASK